MMSGRFTPAAVTEIKISLRPGVGFGRSTAVRTSGPPGLDISMASIEENPLYLSGGHGDPLSLDKSIVEGHHLIEWNPVEIGTGIYFIRMESENGVQMKKCLLLK